VTTNAETLSVLEANHLDVPEGPVGCGRCRESIDDCLCDDEGPDEWERESREAMREERE